MKRTISTKIVTQSALKHIVGEARAEHHIIVWADGVFDLLHIGHIRTLEKAKSLGDILIVGVGSDRAVERAKGRRPVIDCEHRAELIASLRFVDYVLIVRSEDPTPLISAVRPDICVKGGDWSLDKLTERKLVESYGGRIVIVGYVKGISTTATLRKILTEYADVRGRIRRRSTHSS